MYYAIGDIHGELAMLEELMDKLEYKEEDKLVFLGDYVDRGPDAKGVIDYLIALEKIHPNCIFLRGNHEAMFMDYLNNREVNLFLYNGGNTTVASYGGEDTFAQIELPEDHLSFIRRTHRVWETPTIIFVHGGIEMPYDRVEDLPDDVLLWSRASSYKYTVPDKTVVFGHTPFKDVYNNKGLMIGLDTGATFGGKLTCGEINDGGHLQKVVQVKARGQKHE